MARSESSLIEAIRQVKSGNSEFILWGMSGDTDEPWVAAVGNRNLDVTIGESLPDGADGVDFLATGATAIEALEKLLIAMQEGE